MEEWLIIEAFPAYEVSSQGRVRNKSTENILGIYDNGHGVMQVVMRRDLHSFARAVNRLVANAFLDPAPDDCVPMHIDGDWGNNTADNLRWKPRWFAIKQTMQNKRIVPRDSRRVRMMKTGVVYENALECARELGGLEEVVILTAQSQHWTTYLGSAIEFIMD